jgi:hypothetical protein
MRLRFPKPKREAKAKSPVKRTSRPRKQRKGKKAATARKCDLLWSQVVRAQGPCRISADPKYGLLHECNGPLQAAHGFSRRYRNTRWDVTNGFPLCSRAHLALTYDPLRWDDYLRDWWGAEKYQEMKRLARMWVGKPDYPSILVQLTERAKELGVA